MESKLAKNSSYDLASLIFGRYFFIVSEGMKIYYFVYSLSLLQNLGIFSGENNPGSVPRFI